MKTKLLRWILCIPALAPLSARATIPVFDATSFAQLQMIYRTNSSELAKVGQILGVSQEQLNTLRKMNEAIGVVASRGLDGISINQVRAMAQGFGFSDSGRLSQIYQAAGPFSGTLDVFMGMTLRDFESNQRNPLKALSRTAVNDSIRAIGAGVGLSGAEVSFAQRVAAMSEHDVHANRDVITRGLVNLALDRFNEKMTDRRAVIQAESNMAKQAADRAAKSESLNETAAASAEIAAAQVRLQAAAAQQMNDANETMIIQGEQTNETLEAMENRRSRQEVERMMRARANERINN